MRGKGNPIEKNVRDKGNPIEKCAGQRKSYRKMCGAKEILLKKCAGQRKSYRKMCGTKEILLKNVRDKGNPNEILKKPHNLRTIPVTPKILEKTSQSADNPRDPWKSWKKPHNLRTIPGTPKILAKTSQSEPHPSPRPRDLWKSWKNSQNDSLSLVENRMTARFLFTHNYLCPYLKTSENVWFV